MTCNWIGRAHGHRGRKPKLFWSCAVMTFFLLTSFALSGHAADLAPKAAAAYQDASGSSGKSGGLNSEIVKESREAAGEDNQAQLKHSPAVQFVARVTGLSLENAYLLSVLVNFLIIAGAIFWVSKKKLPGFFRSRTASIQKAMEEAGRASEEAKRRLAEIEIRLSKLDEEINAMRAAADEEAAAEEERIKAAAAEDARKIIEAAEQEIAAATKSARRDLTAYAADLAVSLAKKQIRIDAATDQALVRNFVQQLSTDGQSGKDRQ